MTVVDPMTMATLILLPLLASTSTESIETPRDEDGAIVDARLRLGSFVTVERNAIERDLRYDVGERRFDFASYLTPTRDDARISVVAHAELSVSPLPWLQLALTIDSGEVRPDGRVPDHRRLELARLEPFFDDPIVRTTEDSRTPTSNDRPIADEARDSFFVREIYAEGTVPGIEGLSFSLGRRRASIGRGLVFASYGLGAGLALDLVETRDLPFEFSTQVVLPAPYVSQTTASPLFELRATHVVSFAESIGLFFSFFHDGDDNFAEIFLPMVSEVSFATSEKYGSSMHTELSAIAMSSPMSSGGDLFWVGLDGNELLGDFEIAGAVALQLGAISTSNPFAELVRVQELTGVGRDVVLPKDDAIEMSTLAFALDLEARYFATESVSFELSFTCLSGDDNALFVDSSKRTYGGFIGVGPFVPRTNLFFAGGMAETASGQHATTSGINGHGVWAPGVRVDFAPLESLSTSLSTTLLHAFSASVSKGTFYGVETDFGIGWKPVAWLGVSVEYDWMVPGDFFRDATHVHQFVVALDLAYDVRG